MTVLEGWWAYVFIAIAGWLATDVWRWWRVLATVRYWRRARAWVNRLGLPSPGVAALEGQALAALVLADGEPLDVGERLSFVLVFQAKFREAP